MLKSLELHGFKSFADRVRFDFAPGVTCVVGPNGSGKSNVVDALKWLLGDQSAKSLRGKEMTDVIFNGAAGRKPSAFAEATLTFDNSSRLLPLDMPEVQIGRRIWRNGDSEYLINRSAARLKDVRDLFLGTGSSAYSIIEQGRVDQILQANPTNRRAVFEEAAGISRYKSRKVEAQRKLERVAQNLLRLMDIVDEVEARLTSTRNQAAKAAKYRELSQELQLWWHGLAADDYRRLTAEQHELSGQRSDFDRLLSEVNERQRELEIEESSFDGELSRLDHQLRDAERKNAACREVIAGHVTTMTHQAARLHELDGEIDRIRQQQQALHRRTSATQRDVEEKDGFIQLLEQEAAEFQAYHDAQQLELQQRLQWLAGQRADVDQMRIRYRKMQEAATNAAQSLVTESARLATIEATMNRLQAQVQESEANLIQLHTACEQQQAIVRQAQGSHSEAQHHLRQIQAHRQTLLQTQDSAKSSLSDDRERRSAAAARKSLLEDLELRQEGLGIGPKDILSRAQTSRHAPWDTVVGSVADLLEVDLEHAALLEVALGPRAQLIVLTEYQPIWDYVESGFCQLSGRVGFLALAEANAPSSRQPSRFAALMRSVESPVDLTGYPGVVCRADQLVVVDRSNAGLAAAVLADTWIVQTLDAGIRLAGTVGRGCRFITLQGEALETNGALFVGLVRSETALVSRKSELRRLKQELQELDRRIAEQEVALQDVLLSLNGADAQWESATADHDRSLQRLADAKAELAAREQDRDRLADDQKHRAAELASVETALSAARSAVAQTEADADSARSEFQELERQLQATESLLQEAEHHVRELEDQSARDQLELSKQIDRLQSQREQLARLHEEGHQRRLQSEEADRRLQASQAKRQEVALHLLNTRALLDDQHVFAEVHQREVKRLQLEKDRFREQRGALSEQEAQLRARRRELAERSHALELRQREVAQTLATLAERLDEEYQINVAELAQSDASAYRLYLEERAGKTGSGTAAADDEADAVSEPKESSAATFEEIRPELEARVNRLRRKLKLMGSVDTDSLRDLDSLEQRFQSLSAQLQDLKEAQATLDDIIRRINAESRRMFAETFETVRANFQQLFRNVFGGGEGDIILEDPEDILECGIDIKARPPGKQLRSMSLLSGGEKTMTAIALIMAIFRTRPSPFCILDEVDAALDEANVERFTAVVKEFQQTTQFVMITHHKRSMTVADVLYGVTMEESGVSKRMSVRFEDVSEDGHIRSSKSNAA